MRHYDIAFGLGVGCGVALSMREAGVSFLSMPFDWIGCNSPVKLAGIAAGGFRDWMRLEDLEIQSARVSGQDLRYIVKNRRTGLLLPHDFSATRPLAEQYPSFREKMTRRIGRMDEILRKAKTVLLVNVENPQLPGCLADADLEEARRILSDAYPNATFDLVCFQHEKGVETLLEHPVSERLMRVGCRLQQIEHGVVNHTYEHEPIVAWLKANVRVVDPRTDEEIRAYGEHVRGTHADRFGNVGPLARFVTRLQFRAYQKLRKALERKEVIPWERPMTL